MGGKFKHWSLVRTHLLAACPCPGDDVPVAGFVGGACGYYLGLHSVHRHHVLDGYPVIAGFRSVQIMSAARVHTVPHEWSACAARVWLALPWHPL